VNEPGSRQSLDIDAERVRRIRAAETRAAASVRAGTDRLDSVVRNDSDWLTGDTPAPVSALLAVLNAHGVVQKVSPELRERLQGAVTLEAAAQALGARLRRVILEDEWIAYDQGHLIGFREGEPRRVVALIRRRRGYAVVDPAGGGEVMLDSETADEISNAAFAVYPPMPERVDTLIDLGRFLLPVLRGELATVVAVGAVLGLIGVVIPIAISVVFDVLIPGGELNLLVQLGIGLGLAAIFSFLMSILKERALLRLDGRAAATLQGALWSRVLRLPARFFAQYSSGDLRERIVGVSRMRQIVTDVALSATVTAAFSLFYLGLLFAYDARMAALGLALILAMAAITVVVGALQVRYNRRRIEASAWLSGYVIQTLRGIVKLRVAGAEDRAFARWTNRYADERVAIRRARRVGEHFAAFADGYGALTSAALFAAAFYLAAETPSPGVFIAFLAAFGSLRGAFQELSGAVIKVMAAAPDWERGKAVLAEPSETPPDAMAPGRLSGRIEATNISFSYGDGAPILKDVTIEAEPGEQIALVGPSGSGKSTLLRIFLGLERPERGSVLYDNQDLASLDLALVRRQIGVVTQNGRLFAGSIMENVAGVGAANYEDCMAACEAAGLADDLAQFPMGVHTPLTDGASTLSGGQRQRLLIARALVSRPRIIVFDEATSALDNRTQAIVTQSLAQLQATRIVVAHRLSTIRHADRIYVLDKGVIVEAGAFDDLMALDGQFARLARRQML